MARVPYFQSWPTAAEKTSKKVKHQHPTTNSIIIKADDEANGPPPDKNVIESLDFSALAILTPDKQESIVILDNVQPASQY